MLFPSPTQAIDLAVPAAQRLPHGEQVGQDLAGMQQIGQPVDDRNRCVAGQLLDVGMIVGADHDAVEIAGQHPGGVADRLAPAQLDVARGEEERVPAELERADLEGDPGAGGALGEDHPQRLALRAACPGSRPRFIRAARSKTASSSGLLKSGIARKCRVIGWGL